MTNTEIKELIRKNRLYGYEVAERVGITEFTLCRWFRKEMTDEQKEKVISAIKALKAEE